LSSLEKEEHSCLIQRNNVMSDKSSFDHLIKLLLIGDSGVGKSCLLLRFSDDSFTSSFITTVGIDFKVKTINLDGKRIKLQIWDTAGQERFRTITTSYYRGAMGVMLVYDVTDEKTFNNIRNWMSNIEKHASEQVIKMILGNKCDMEDKRVIEAERGKALADEYGVEFFETSAKDATNVELAFMTMVQDVKKKIIDKSEATPQPTVVNVDNGNSQNNGNNNCSC